ncbi:MAG: DUF1501 domain-containing protein, partial [Planctomycetes bacterium]|nr:DUF1501 domain-containing protein [Planctomycetota bacterium]
MSTPRQPTRRDFLRRAANGFAMLPFAQLLHDDGGPRVPHHAPRAKAVIFLYMDGGPSPQDLFDYKPRLVADDGKPFAMKKEPTQFQKDGNTLGPRWPFRQRGESGQWISDLLPNLATVADRLCVIRSMVAEFSEHTNANYFLHTGHGLQGRPSMGAWIDYGLGSASQELPGFVVLNGGLIPPGGVDNFHSGFLPAHCQGSRFAMRGQPLANLQPLVDPGRQRTMLQLGADLDRLTLAERGDDPALEAAIQNGELA